jgi:hypothetical protein
MVDNTFYPIPVVPVDIRAALTAVQSNFRLFLVPVLKDFNTFDPAIADEIQQLVQSGSPLDDNVSRTADSLFGHLKSAHPELADHVLYLFVILACYYSKLT